MFFDDVDLVPRTLATLKVIPPTPETNWTPPKWFPRLDDVVYVGYDWETKERDFTRGPGWSRGMSHIVGGAVNIVYRGGEEFNAYFPMRHEVDTHLNLDADQCESFFKDLLKLDCDKCAANNQFEYGNAVEMGAVVNGLQHDPQVAEALLTEGGNVALEDLAQKWLNLGKESDIGYQWSALAYGGNPTGSQRSNIYRWSPKLAGPYGEQDARLLRPILQQQWKHLEAENLLDIYRMENDFVPLLVKMRKAGVRVDLDHAERMKKRTTQVIDEQYKLLYDMTGVHFSDLEDDDSVRSGDALAKAFDAVGVKYPRTENKTEKYPDGAPSFRKEWLKNLDHPLAELILTIREHLTLRDTFLQSYILDGNINGRVHCQFHPLKGEEKGTRSGRFSSSTPNLQNIPSRTTLGKEIRECFVPDYGHIGWRKLDYSQIEYRFLAHFAVDNIGTRKRPIFVDGESSTILRKRYNDDPTTDYHDAVYDKVAVLMGWDVSDKALRKEKRPGIKNTNFGLVYAMGRAKLARQLGLTSKQADEFFEAYHGANPYVQSTMDQAASIALETGSITTILGRKSRFELWEPMFFNDPSGARPMALSYEMAIRTYGPKIKRAGAHKAINRRLQGSAAELLKMSLWLLDRSGVFDVIGVPELTVHDELDWSQIDDTPQTREAFDFVVYTMENAIPLRVPVKVETDYGPNWGKAEKLLLAA